MPRGYRDYNSGFASKIQKTDSCWLWTGEVRKPSGLPVYRKEVAQRVSWRLAHSADAPDDRAVKTTCKNRICVNPDHLTLDALGKPADPVDTRFWNYVEKTESCWNWTGAVHTSGYGRIGISAKEGMEYAHRFSFTLHHRPLKPNEWVAHACDNKLCVNPAHLFTSDGNRENMQDATTKHILHHGERHYNAKLTDAQVTWVREQYTTGQQRIRDMAAQLGCTAHHLSDVIHYRRRKKETQHPTPGLQSALQTKLDD